MADTLYATFSDANHAEQAAGALMDHGVRAEDISLVSGGHNETGTVRTGNDIDYNTSESRTEEAGSFVGNKVDAAGNRVAAWGNQIIGNEEGAAARHTMADMHNQTAEESKGAAWGSGENSGPTGVINDNTESYTDTNTTTTTSTSGTDLHAKAGITTTTPEDAGVGAIKGAGIGIGVGALAAIASLFIPGVGLVVGGGALATALGAVAATAGAGAVAGGVTGYLKDQGVPEDKVHHYNEAITGGGAVLSVNVPSGNCDRTRVEEVLAKYGAANVNTYGNTGQNYNDNRMNEVA